MCTALAFLLFAFCMTNFDEIAQLDGNFLFEGAKSFANDQISCASLTESTGSIGLSSCGTMAWEIYTR